VCGFDPLRRQSAVATDVAHRSAGNAFPRVWPVGLRSRATGAACLEISLC